MSFRIALERTTLPDAPEALAAKSREWFLENNPVDIGENRELVDAAVAALENVAMTLYSIDSSAEFRIVVSGHANPDFAQVEGEPTTNLTISLAELPR